MNKSIMLSIHPNWCERIIRGYKTIEVRKTKPKLETPFKCYIYCTKNRLALLRDDEDKEEQYKFDVWKHAGFHESFGRKVLNGKVIGEFVCDYIIPISTTYSDPESRLAQKEFPYTCLTDKDIINYLGNGKQGYGWHIYSIKIYNTPKELSEFYQLCRIYDSPNEACGDCAYLYKDERVFKCKCDGEKPMERPPQSWCYVRKVGDRE